MTVLIIIFCLIVVSALVIGIVKKTRKVIIASLFGLFMILMFGIGFFMTVGSM